MMVCLKVLRCSDSWGFISFVLRAGGILEGCLGVSELTSLCLCVCALSNPGEGLAAQLFSFQSQRLWYFMVCKTHPVRV